MSIEVTSHEVDWLESTGSPDHLLLAQFLQEMVVGVVFDDNAAMQAVLATWPEFFQRKQTGQEKGLFKDVWLTKDSRVVTDGGATALHLAHVSAPAEQ